MTELYQLRNHYCTAGLIVENDMVIATAPILKRFRKWTITGLKNYCLYQGWELEKL